MPPFFISGRDVTTGHFRVTTGYFPAKCNLRIPLCNRTIPVSLPPSHTFAAINDITASLFPLPHISLKTFGPGR